MMQRKLMAALVCGILAMSGGVQAAPGKCFFASQFENWKSPDAKTIYIRVGVHDYYRLDLSTRCSMLQSPTSHLVTRFVGSNTVCAPIDWDLQVADSAGMRQGCIVKTMTPLTSEEAAAIPAKFKP
jgi:uncharacterized protein DUF6491